MIRNLLSIRSNDIGGMKAFVIVRTKIYSFRFYFGL